VYSCSTPVEEMQQRLGNCRNTLSLYYEHTCNLELSQTILIMVQVINGSI